MLTPKKNQSRINHQHYPRRKTTGVILSKTHIRTRPYQTTLYRLRAINRARWKINGR
jgi:hypothetical protein